MEVKENMYKPLADRLRPSSLEEIFGQKHLIGKGKLITRMVETNSIPNMIFYGASGTGKTTVANIIAKSSKKKFFKLNATNSNTQDINDVIKNIGTLETQNGILLYVDELHYATKRQQQSILEFIETGDITLIGSTTENVNFTIFKSLLSRCLTVEFKELDSRALNILRNEKDKNITIDEIALNYIADISSGDLRRAINILEVVININSYLGEASIEIDLAKVMECNQSKITKYDKDGEGHYNLLSYFQKCIRGSHPEASIHALGRLIKSGDLTSICRRLLVIASEDIGLAYPSAISITKDCVDSALMLGFPEAKIPLAEATLLLATAPKSNSAYKAIAQALRDIDTIDVGSIPEYLCDQNSNIGLTNNKKYIYPHDHPNHYYEQQYMPDKIKDKIYYVPGKNKFEQSVEEFLRRIRG
jgi:putative ATPase